MDKNLLRLLACPRCQAPVMSKDTGRLRCSGCRAVYVVKHGIPVMVDLDHLPEHLRGQIRYFNASSALYDTPDAIEPWQDKYKARLSEHIRMHKGNVFVDNACGSGYMGLYAANHGATVLACDLNMSGLIRLLRQARRMGLGDRFFAVCCTSEELPIRALIADAVVSNAILEHLPREKEAIREISRITKKNGITMVTVPLAYHLLNPIFLLLNYLYDKRIGHLRRYTSEMLLERFSDWKLLDYYYTGHTRKVLKTIINMVKPVFDPLAIEEEDELYIKKKMFASNVSIVLRKK